MVSLTPHVPQPSKLRASSPYLQLLPRARSFSGAPEQLPQTPCHLSSPACFLDKDKMRSDCHSGVSGHIQTLISMSDDYILCMIWPANFHMAAKQELSFGWVTRVRFRRDSPLASHHCGTTTPYLGVTQGDPGWARDRRCLFFASTPVLHAFYWREKPDGAGFQGWCLPWIFFSVSRKSPQIRRF